MERKGRIGERIWNEKRRRRAKKKAISENRRRVSFLFLFDDALSRSFLFSFSLPPHFFVRLLTVLVGGLRLLVGVDANRRRARGARGAEGELHFERKVLVGFEERGG